MDSLRSFTHRPARPLVLAAAVLWGAVELVALQRQRWRLARGR